MRLQVRSKDSLRCFDSNYPLPGFLLKSDKLNKPLDVAIIIGADPVTLEALTTGRSTMDRYEIAGGLAKEPIEMVKCQTVDLEVPAHAQFVLEGHILPNVREKEGPFPEVAGFYHTFDSRVVKINVITHRRKPIFHAWVPFGGENATEEVFGVPKVLPEIQREFPFVKGMTRHAGMVVFQIEKKSDEDVRKIVDHALGWERSKIILIIDDDIDIDDPRDIDWALGTRSRLDTGVTIYKEQQGGPFDLHFVKAVRDERGRRRTLIPKMVIDVTKPLDKLDHFVRLKVPDKVEEKIRTMMEKY